MKCPYRYKYELIAWARTYTNIPLKVIRKMNKKQCGGGMMCGGAVGPNGIL